MAGHSKWANIKHRKGAQDAKRGKIFTKLIREITVAAKMGGEDTSSNPRLKLAIDKALGANMTKDTIERAVKRGAGNLDGENMEALRYEGYGPNGVAVMVDCLTDNKNRTVSEVRHAFSKCGGNLGTDGSVSYLFNKVGLLAFSPETDEDQLMEAALDVGADDVITHDDGSFEVVTDPNDFSQVKEALEAQGLTADHADITMQPETTAPLDAEQAIKLLRMIDILEDLDDVQEVYSNADIPEDAMAEQG